LFRYYSRGSSFVKCFLRFADSSEATENPLDHRRMALRSFALDGRDVGHPVDDNVTVGSSSLGSLLAARASASAV
jgi:hypothetical protein